MWKFIKDFIMFPFQKDRSSNKITLLFNSLFKDFPAFFWEKPTLKKMLMAPLLVIYHIFSKGEKKEKKPE
ncbi:MAG: hypothetical protein K6E76_01345 [Patescibacteria group bacterium]|jgi:hypothetical protein|nr:hypothetical protein [Patescibacteria group bacterium]